jgi:Cytochrome C'
MTRTAFVLRAALPALLIAAGVAAAQPPPGAAGTGAPPAAADAPVALDLDPAAREALRRTMREHLEALQAVVAALARDDYRAAATVAHEELGFPKHHEAMRREGGADLPQRYRELAMAHHRSAEDLAQAAATGDMQATLRALDRTVQACVACHRAYRL